MYGRTVVVLRRVVLCCAVLLVIIELLLLCLCYCGELIITVEFTAGFYWYGRADFRLQKLPIRASKSQSTDAENIQWYVMCCAHFCVFVRVWGHEYTLTFDINIDLFFA